MEAPPATGIAAGRDLIEHRTQAPPQAAPRRAQPVVGHSRDGLGVSCRSTSCMKPRRWMLASELFARCAWPNWIVPAGARFSPRSRVRPSMRRQYSAWSGAAHEHTPTPPRQACLDLVRVGGRRPALCRNAIALCDGSIAELFLPNHRANSAADTNARDSALAFSFAVQHGADPEAIRRALSRDSQGRACGPLGQALDIISKESAS